MNYICDMVRSTDNTFFLKHGHVSTSSRGSSHVKLRSLYLVGYVIVIRWVSKLNSYELVLNGDVKVCNFDRGVCNKYLDSLYMSAVILKDSNLFNGIDD